MSSVFSYLYNYGKFVLVLVITVGTGGCMGSIGSSAFVTHEDSDFLLNNEPFRFVGANIYNAAGDPLNAVLAKYTATF